jgi:hypothetical protein
MSISPETSKSGFSFKLEFLVEDVRKINQIRIDILVDETDNPEADQYRAYCLTYEKAEGLLEINAAEGFQVWLC